MIQEDYDSKTRRLATQTVMSLLRRSGADVRIATETDKQALFNGKGAGVRKMTVYHGSGAKFNSFSNTHIGEGEGAHVHGVGIYVSVDSDVAETYAATLDDIENVRFEASGIGGFDRHDLAEYIKDTTGLDGHTCERFADTAAVHGVFAAMQELYQEAEFRRDIDPDFYYKARDVDKMGIREETNDSLSYLYEVNIPEGPYIEEDVPLPSEEKESIVKSLAEYICPQDAEERSSELANIRELMRDSVTGGEIYDNIAEYLGETEYGKYDEGLASDYLKAIGYKGIHYYGNQDGECYVIFDSGDITVRSRTEIMKNSDGSPLGWQKGNTVYLDKYGINPNTPIHEYTHLWARSMQKNNPEGWDSIKSLLKGTFLWESIRHDEDYRDIADDADELASEVLARTSGNSGELWMLSQSKAYLRQTGGRGTSTGLLERIFAALDKFWSWVGKDLFGIKKFSSAREAADRVLYDFVNGTDLRLDGLEKDGISRAMYRKKPIPSGEPSLFDNNGEPIVDYSREEKQESSADAIVAKWKKALATEGSEYSVETSKMDRDNLVAPLLINLTPTPLFIYEAEVYEPDGSRRTQYGYDFSRDTVEGKPDYGKYNMLLGRYNSFSASDAHGYAIPNKPYIAFRTPLGARQFMIFSSRERRDYERTENDNLSTNRSTHLVDDIGEKIGGAKKDRYAEMNDTIRATLAAEDADILSRLMGTSISNLFKLDIAKLREAGLSNEGATLMAAIRDTFPAKPRKEFRLKMWARSMAPLYRCYFRATQDPAATLKSMRDSGLSRYEALARYDALMALGGYDKHPVIPGAILYPTEVRNHEGGNTWRLSGCRGKNKHFFNKFYLTYDEAVRSLRAYAFSSQKEKELVTVKESAEKYDAKRNTSTGEGFICVKGKPDLVLFEGFKTQSDAYAFLKSHSAEFFDKRLAEIKEGNEMVYRDNEGHEGQSWRHGGHISPMAFKNAFGFRALEFGLWVPDSERQMNIDKAFDALMDMSLILGVRPQDISHNRRLSIAFGSRGVGGAWAHYEYGPEVINLTRKNGIGNIAHEWLHSLDNAYAKKAGSDRVEGMATNGDGLEWSDKRKVDAATAHAWLSTSGILSKSDYGNRSRKYASLASDYWKRPWEVAARAYSIWCINELGRYAITNTALAADTIMSEAEATPDMKKYYPYPFDTESDMLDKAFKPLFATLRKGVAKEYAERQHMLVSPSVSANSNRLEKMLQEQEGRWHHGNADANRAELKIRELLAGQAGRPLTMDYYVKTGDIRKSLVLSRWSEVNDFRIPIFFTRRQMEEKGLHALPGAVPLPLPETSPGGKGSVDYFNIEQIADIADKAYKDPAVLMKYLQTIADTYSSPSYSDHRAELEDKVSDSKWLTPVRLCDENRIDKGRSAIYDSRTGVVQVLRKSKDDSTSDRRAYDITEALTDSIIARRRDWSAEHKEDVRMMTRQLNALYFNIDLPRLKGRDITAGLSREGDIAPSEILSEAGEIADKIAGHTSISRSREASLSDQELSKENKQEESQERPRGLHI